MTIPNLDFGMDEAARKERLRRSIMGQLDTPTQLPPSVTAPVMGRPQDFLPTAPSAPPGQYTLAELGNADVSRPVAGHPVRDRILAALDGALRGASVGNDPDARGTSGFLGALGQGYAGMQNRREQQQRQSIADRIAAQTAQQEAALREAQIENYRSEAANRGQSNVNLSLDYINDPNNPNQQLGVNRDPRTGLMRPATDFLGRPVVRPKAERPEAIPEWQRQGYASFDAWRADKMQPSEGERRAAGLLSGAREALGDVEGAVRQGFSPNAEPALSQAIGALFNNSTWRNATASPVGQRYYTAVERLFNNYLYTVSGAQVPPSEIANQARQATVAFFDAKGTREQKMNSLRGKLHEMEIMAGRDLGAASTPDPVP